MRSETDGPSWVWGPDVWASLCDPCLIVERQGQITAANPAACEFLCSHQSVLEGANALDAIDSVSIPELRELTVAISRGHAQVLPIAWRRGNGSSVHVDTVVLPANWNGRQVAMYILRSDDAQYAQATSPSWRVSQLEDLYLASALLQGDMPLADLLTGLAERVCALTSAQSSGIYTHDPERDVLVLRAAFGFPQSSVGTELDRGVGISWQCFTTGQVINTSRYADQDRAIDLDATFDVGNNHYQSIPVLVVPLIFHGEKLGILALGEPEGGRPFGPSDEYIGRFLANQVAISVQQSRLFAEIKATAEALADANEDLQRIDLIKDDFMMMVSHELQQPLATARLGIDLVLHEKSGLDERHRDLLAQSVTNLGALDDIIDSMLFFASLRMPVGETYQPVDFGHIVKSVACGILAEARDKGLEARLVVPNTPVLVRVPLEALRRMTEHLLDNACKFTASGSIHVEVSERHGEARLAVTDTGIGFTPDQERRLFEAFYQADGSSRRAYDGLGLGLAVVRRVAELYGGRVAVSSDPGSGSRFEVSFDLADEG